MANGVSSLKSINTILSPTECFLEVVSSTSKVIGIGHNKPLPFDSFLTLLNLKSLTTLL